MKTTGLNTYRPPPVLPRPWREIGDNMALPTFEALLQAMQAQALAKKKLKDEHSDNVANTVTSVTGAIAQPFVEKRKRENAFNDAIIAGAAKGDTTLTGPDGKTLDLNAIRDMWNNRSSLSGYTMSPKQTPAGSVIMVGPNGPTPVTNPITGQPASTRDKIIVQKPETETKTPKDLATIEAEAAARARGTASVAPETQAAKDKATRDAKLQGLTGALDFFERKINEIPGGAGIGGRFSGLQTLLGAKLQTDPKAAAYLADVEGLRSQIVRGLGDVGNLSEYEQKYASSLLPKITDNIETRKQKLANFREYINSRISTSGSGSDMRGDPLGIR